MLLALHFLNSFLVELLQSSLFLPFCLHVLGQDSYPGRLLFFIHDMWIINQSISQSSKVAVWGSDKLFFTTFFPFSEIILIPLQVDLTVERRIHTSI